MKLGTRGDRMERRMRSGSVLLGQEEPDLDFFDLRVKLKMQEEMVRLRNWDKFPYVPLGVEGHFEIVYFYALFPSEFHSLDQISGLKERIVKQMNGELENENYQDQFKAAIACLHLFPEELKNIHLSEESWERLLENWARGGVDSPRELLLRQVLVGKGAQTPEQYEQEWHSVQRFVHPIPVDLDGLMRVAYLRFIFPDKFNALRLEGMVALKRYLDDVLAKRVWESMSSGATSRPIDCLCDYAKFAWAMNILLAQEVGFTEKGCLYFKLPQKRSMVSPELPHRSQF